MGGHDHGTRWNPTLRSPKEPKNLLSNPKNLGFRGLGRQDAVRV